MGDSFNASRTKTNLRRAKKGLRTDSDSHCPQNADSESQGTANQRQRVSRTLCTGSSRQRPKPRTHGKTLSYLIEELRDQIEDCQLDRERLEHKEQRLKERLSDLEQVLAEWQETVETLAPEDPPTPTE